MTMSKMPPKVCFVSLSSYPTLTEKNLGYVGGAEVQQVFLAKELVKHSYKVSFITYGDEQTSTEYVGDIEVIKVYRQEDASRLSLVTKVRSIWKAMRKANADIYFHEAGAAGVVSLFCFLQRKKFIQYIPSDANVSKELAFPNWRFYHRIANRLDIKRANAVVAQSEFQKEMLEKNFGRESNIIKNAFPLPAREMPQKTNPPVILWVATIGEVKQPELFLKLAEAVPEASFQMIGGGGNDLELYNKVKKSSTKITNLDFLGFVPFHIINEYFERASIFINTSKIEGFPNTFIQAWMNYTPVVSLNSDPDEIICKYRLGFHSKTFDQLVKDTRTLLQNPSLRKELGENGRRYVEKEHNISNVVDSYIEIFNKLLIAS